MYLNDVFTVTVNMAGLPASPCRPAPTCRACRSGCNSIGRPFDEETLFSLGHVIEAAAGQFRPRGGGPDALTPRFRSKLEERGAGEGLAPELQALWWAGKGRLGPGAPRVVMDEHSRDAAWVHTYIGWRATTATPNILVPAGEAKPLPGPSIPSGNSL